MQRKKKRLCMMKKKRSSFEGSFLRDLLPATHTLGGEMSAKGMIARAGVSATALCLFGVLFDCGVGWLFWNGRL